MKLITLVLCAGMLFGCNQLSKKPKNYELINDSQKQDFIFKQLINIAGDLPGSIQGDSLAFLILPVQASCPSCRKKTIDSILKHKGRLMNNHFIVVSANGGRKIISSYFKEQGEDIPSLNDQLILDSTNQSHKFHLFKDNPAIYYTSNRKVYKKVLAIPATVKEDLHEFFSGDRSSAN